ncbi:hypothetical protein AtEden1_Chr2g0231891 [Arabidopsis thaliana]
MINFFDLFLSDFLTSLRLFCKVWDEQTTLQALLEHVRAIPGHCQKKILTKRLVTDIWDKEDTKLLAALKHIDVRPTRVACRPSLQVLGLYNDVVTVFQTHGMGWYREIDEDVYPKLVKEFIATCRLTYANPENPKASQGTLTFFLNKKHYNKTMFEIYDMYGFTKGEAVEFSKLSPTHITSLLSTTNPVFEHNEQYLVPDPSKIVPRRRRTAEAQPTDEHVISNDEIYEDYAYPTSLAHAQPYLLLPEDPAPYRVSPPPAGDDISQQMAWMIASTRKNNSMMHKMWRAISRIRPCVCTRRGGVDDANRENQSKTIEDRHAERLVPAAGPSGASTSQPPPEHSQAVA